MDWRKIVLAAVLILALVGLGGWGLKRSIDNRHQASMAAIEASLMQSDEGPLFALIKRGFAEEYQQFLAAMADLIDGDQPLDLRMTRGAQESFRFVSGLRRDNAAHVLHAPVEKVRAIARTTLEVFTALEDNPEACARFGRFGGGGLEARDITPALTQLLANSSLTVFEAILAGRDTPVDNPPEQPGDREAFITAWVEATAPDEALRTALRTGTGSSADMCALFTSLERFVVEDTSPLTQRMLVVLKAENVGR